MNALIIFFKGVWEGQKLFGEIIATLVNTLLLSVVYFIGVGVTTFFAQISHKEFLDVAFNISDKKIKSHWQELNLTKKPLEEYYRQF